MSENKEYKDITLVCKSCGTEFNYSVTEQKFFEEKGFGAPIRCHDCRNAKKARNVEYETKKENTTHSHNSHNIDPNNDWVGAMNERWNEQVVQFKTED